MNLTLRGCARGLACAALLFAFTAADSELLAHWRPRRHVHRRRVIVVGRVVPVKRVVQINGKPHGTLDFRVDPSTTEVLVNGKLRGTVDDFDGSPQKLHLLPGLHKITLKTPDGEKVVKNIDIRAGTEIEIKLDFEN